MTPRYLVNLYREYQKELKFCKHSNIKIFNFWPLSKPEDLWFNLFLQQRNLLPSEKQISIYSVFGDRFKMKFDLFRPKIFFTGENIIFRPNYSDHCLSHVQLSLGFEYIEHPRYLRFPLWYLYFIRPWYTLSDVESWLASIEVSSHDPHFFNRKFCSIVAGHDPSHNRKKAFDIVGSYGMVDSGGKFLNNTSIMWENYKNDKVRFLSDYQYNIAFENSDCSGYVTEKIFHALIAGCIPIYWGAHNIPEPEILNQKRILFFDPSNPDGLHNQLSYLQNRNNLSDFVAQPVFNSGAAEKIYERFTLLENRIRAIV